MSRDLERVKVRLQELRIDLKTFLFDFLDVLKHAQSELSFDFFRAAWIQACIKGYDRAIFHEGELEDRLQAQRSDPVTSDIYNFQVLIIA